MKFVFALVALASVAAVNAAPGLFFDENGLELKPLEEIQINNRKIKLAGEDIDITEGKLQTLASKAKEVAEAAQLVMDAATVKAWKEGAQFAHTL